jgi:alkylation response protein AidB-like acyl-CoA dehydrogenase
VGAQRLEGVHHQLRHRHHLDRHRHGAHRRRDLGVRRPGRHAGDDHRAGLRQARLARSDTHGITFVDCRIPAENLLGARAGFRNFLSILDDGRIAISALALGSARACLEIAVDYAKQRHAFGGPIGRFQGLAFQLSDLAVQVENAHNLTYKAAWLKDQGRPIGQAAAMAKLYSTEAPMDAARVGPRRCSAGWASWRRHRSPRFYRDAKILEIGEGTSEIQRLVIAREPRPPRPLVLCSHDLHGTHTRSPTTAVPDDRCGRTAP